MRKFPLIKQRAPESVIRDKHRIGQTGEVFTRLELVDEMLMALDDENLWTDITKTFLDPACGDGNFLVRFLHFKWQGFLRSLEKPGYNGVIGFKTREETERAAPGIAVIGAPGSWTPMEMMLGTIWGLDIMEDNIEVARSRLIELAAALTQTTFEDASEKYSDIVSHRVTVGDFLNWNCAEWRPMTEEEKKIRSDKEKLEKKLASKTKTKKKKG